jgi:hypothetical protein
MVQFGCPKVVCEVGFIEKEFIAYVRGLELGLTCIDIGRKKRLNLNNLMKLCCPSRMNGQYETYL